MKVNQPKCNCFECKSYSFIYSSIFDTYKCLECTSTVSGEHIEAIIEAFSVYQSSTSPVLIPNYNAIYCISCLDKGGIHFKKSFTELVSCELCKYSIFLYSLHDAMVIAYRTKLIERSYGQKFLLDNL